MLSDEDKWNIRKAKASLKEHARIPQGLGEEMIRIIEKLARGPLAEPEAPKKKPQKGYFFDEPKKSDGPEGK